MIKTCILGRDVAGENTFGMKWRDVGIWHFLPGGAPSLNPAYFFNYVLGRHTLTSKGLSMGIDVICIHWVDIHNHINTHTHTHVSFPCTYPLVGECATYRHTYVCIYMCTHTCTHVCWWGNTHRYTSKVYIYFVHILGVCTKHFPNMSSPGP